MIGEGIFEKYFFQHTNRKCILSTHFKMIKEILILREMFLLNFSCVLIFVSLYLCTACIFGAFRGQIELWTLVDHYMSTRNKTWVLFFKQLSPLINPYINQSLVWRFNASI